MPRKKTQKVYFGDKEEEAVVRFLNTESEVERNKIFNEYLYPPLVTMVESIIRRYKLYRKNIDFDEILNDSLSFIMLKFNKYDNNQNTKAYSYFGTICKNYLMGSILKETKDVNKTISYEDISSDIEDNADLSYVIDEVPIDYISVIEKLLEELEDFMLDPSLTENEKKLGYALIDIISNYENINAIGEGDKFNKNLILLYLREMTGLTTKDIRLTLKRFKTIYRGTLSKFL